jgi:transposase InsO family protein
MKQRPSLSHIEIFYNRQRLQKRLSYLSPAAYERRYYADKMMA